MDLNPDWKEFIELLISNEVEFVVIGAFARALHGIPRFTLDIDFLVSTEPDNADKVVKTVREFGFSSLGLQRDDFIEPGKVIQLGFPPRRIDLLTSIAGVEFKEVWETRQFGRLEGIQVPFISKEMYVLNKRAVGRTKDLADIEAILDEDEIS